MPADSWDVVVVGAGAAGLFAAAAAAERGRRTIVLEKNRKIGVKILMSGGTRCNITHDCSPREIAQRFAHARKFLEFPIGRLPPERVVKTINDLGVPTKVESTGKIFPASDSAVHVRDALVRKATEAGAEIRNECGVRSISKQNNRFICETDAGVFTSDSVILTTGGQSYPGCGTTGDGYVWAKQFGHTIVTPRPALTPLVSDVQWVNRLSGVTIQSCAARSIDGQEKEVAAWQTASLLFTHSGLSGPLAMNQSRWFTMTDDSRARILEVNFLPEKTRDQWITEFNEYASRHGGQRVGRFPCQPLPNRLVESLLSVAGIDPTTPMAELGKKNVRALATAISGCRIDVSGTKGFAKAEVTAGGIALGEVDNRTMRSRKLDGLYLAGEILDVDGPIGGFNFQAAFSTGHLAGLHA